MDIKILSIEEALEYAKAHQLHDKNKFIACYENAYIEASYPDHHPISFSSEENFDQQVLKSVLVKLKMI